jgi:hypothetical protein
MDYDDLLQPKGVPESAESSFGGALGATITGFAWVAVFAAIAALMLWVVVHWL